MKSSTAQKLFFLFCCLAVLTKFALVSQNEIHAYADDSAVYAHQSLVPNELGYPEGYPVWLMICQFFDVPQRLAIEALYLGAVMVLAFGARRSLGAVTGYVIAALLPLAPFTYFLFDSGLSDGFFCALTLLGLGVNLHLFASAGALRRAWLWAIGFGACLGVMAVTRNEDPLLAFWALLFLVALGVLWRWEPSGERSGKWLWGPIGVALITVMVSALIVGAMDIYYYKADSVFARNLALVPGHTELLKKLAQIDTGEPSIHYVPISKKSREMAYAVSPTLAEIRPVVEDPNDRWQRASRDSGIPAGEIGGGWVWHVFNRSFLQLNGEQPARVAAKYRKVNGELDAAFRSGRLRKRFILHPLLGGDVGRLPADMIGSMPPVVHSAFHAQTEEEEEPADALLFDAAFGRRALLERQDRRPALAGWAFVNKAAGDRPARAILGVAVETKAEGRVPVLAEARPDVTAAFTDASGWKPLAIGFHAVFTNPSLEGLTLTYVLEDGSRVVSPNALTPGIRKVAGGGKTGDEIVQGIDQAGVPPRPRTDSLHRKQARFIIYWERPAVMWTLVLAVVLAFGLTGYAVFGQRRREFEVFFVSLAFVGTLWATQIVFYSLINARAWPGDQIRYLAPAQALWMALVAIAVGSLVELVVRRKSTRV